jgi:Kef-type K+ transport system membrane component KefB
MIMNNILSNIWFVAAIWMGLALIASLISIRLKITVALIEIFTGIFAGNFLGIHQTTDWINFLAMLGSGVITFLAGAEIDPVSLKANLRPSLVIGVLSFIIPFIIVWFFAQFVLGWGLHQAQIAGIALSTTSVAVVYAVMIETGHSNTALGKMILAACFITDFGTVLTLGILFANFNWWMLLFVTVMCIMLWYMPRWTKFIIVRMGASHQVSEPEIKFLLFILFFLGGLSTTAKSEAVLPAYLMGLVIAGVFMRDKTVVNRMRSIAFAIFTPFYFIKAGLYVSLPAAWSAIGIIAFLFFIKMGSKYIVFPFARVFSMRSKESHYTSLLMGTGLTFGTIASLYGLNNHIINQKQYTILVTVVILSAVLPTLFAQKYFKPKESTMNAWGRLRNKNDFIKSNELTEEKAGTH